MHLKIATFGQNTGVHCLHTSKENGKGMKRYISSIVLISFKYFDNFI